MSFAISTYENLKLFMTTAHEDLFLMIVLLLFRMEWAFILRWKFLNL